MGFLRTSLLGNLFPVIIHQEKSNISGEVTIKEQLGIRELTVGGVTQSAQLGSKKVRVWESLAPTVKVNTVLVLGLGAGTVVTIIKQRYPDTKITAVEIDPVIVKLAKKYFNLNRDIKVRVGDARNFLAEGVSFDYIIVDLYLGRHNPEFSSEETFLRDIRSSLNQGGSAVFNRVPLFEGKESVKKFENILQQTFNKFSLQKVGANRVYKVKL